MAKFRKKPVVIEAIQWNGENELEIMQFMNQELKYSKPPHQMVYDMDVPNNAWQLHIPTLEDGNASQVEHIADKMDWIIKGVKGEFYPCKDQIFKMTYDAIQE